MSSTNYSVCNNNLSSKDSDCQNCNNPITVGLNCPYAAWEKIVKEVTSKPQDVPTIIQKSGSIGKWFHAIGNGEYIIIEAAKSHKPSCRPSYNTKIEITQFVKLYKNYSSWRAGTLNREDAKAGTFISSYVFGLINKFNA